MKWPRRVFGLLTLLFAAVYLLVGLAFIVGAVNMSDQGGEWQPLLTMFAGFLAAFGVGLALLGGAVFLAGVGLLTSNQAGWWFAFFLSAPITSFGWFLVAGPDPGAAAMTAGIVQLSYPLFAVVACVASRGK